MTRVAWIAVILTLGCHRAPSGVARQAIGAPCTSDASCGGGPTLHCATDHAGGYCEATCRNDRECPSGSVCVGGDPISTGACHRVCDKSNPDACRVAEGYRCIHEGDAAHDYCDPPGRSRIDRRIRGGAWRW
jgi:hypothetical protein